MEMPPWHVGHVVRKVMEAQGLKGVTLAKKAGVRRMTISHLLSGGTPEDGTLEKVCRALGCSKAELYAEVDRSNGGYTLVAPVPETGHQRRASDRSVAQRDADHYADRLLRLSNSAQIAIFNVIRAFEEATGLFQTRDLH